MQIAHLSRQESLLFPGEGGLYKAEQHHRKRQINYIRSPARPGKVGKHRKIGQGPRLLGDDLQENHMGLAIVVCEWVRGGG